MVATLRMSTRLRVGLLGVSIQMSLVSLGRMSEAISTSIEGVKVTVTPWAAATFVK